MDDRDFNELAGRIEGLAQSYLLLASMLQRQGAVDTQQLQARLRTLADALPPHQSTAQRTLIELSDVLLRDYLTLHGKTAAEVAAAMQPDQSAEDGT